MYQKQKWKRIHKQSILYQKMITLQIERREERQNMILFKTQLQSRQQSPEPELLDAILCIILSSNKNSLFRDTFRIITKSVCHVQVYNRICDFYQLQWLNRCETRRLLFYLVFQRREKRTDAGFHPKRNPSCTNLSREFNIFAPRDVARKITK